MSKKQKPTKATPELPASHHRAWNADGTPVLEFIFSFASAESLHPHIKEYYISWLRTVELHCENTLVPPLQKAFLENPDPRRRYTHRRTILRAECKATHHDDLCVVQRTLVLRMPGGTQTQRFEERFSPSDGRLLPPLKYHRQKRAKKTRITH